MKLAAMDLENFRCFEKLHIEFDEKLTVLVGANGAGKTAIIDAVAYFLKIYAENFCEFPEGSDCGALTDIRSGRERATLEFDPHDVGDDEGAYARRVDLTKDSLAQRARVNARLYGHKRLPGVPLTTVVRYGAVRTLDSFKQNANAPQDGYSAYANAFDPQIDFSTALAWFIAKASEEALKAMRRIEDVPRKLADLSAVRTAISSALGDYNEPYVDDTPHDLFITHKSDPDTPLTVRQLSDGYRTMLALIMDLARRMAVANAEAEWPEGQSVLHSPGIVLIDEVEQHLHPAWQQTVLPRLMEIFPNVQFIVTTHSPQVLTSIPAKHIRILRDGAAYTFPEETDGAEAGRVLEDVLGVSPRPNNDASRDLKKYEKLVNDGQWDTPEAEELKRELEAHFGDSEPKLDELALRIETMKWERGL